MKAHRINENIYWVGAIDWDVRNFHGYSTPRGTTYNSYLILDEKIVLIDTVKAAFTEHMLSRISELVDPSKIDIVVSNHVEMDHSGGLPRLADICRNATFVASPNGVRGLGEHYKGLAGFRAVDNAEEIDTGSMKLKFLHAKMVHWPDSMATYIPEKGFLFSNDAFGQHIASARRYDRDIGWHLIKEEAAKYYANIVLPYGNQVSSVLESLKDLEIRTIAPSHGMIWTENIQGIVEQYRKWSSNDTDEEVVIVYDSMWGSTAKMALTLSDVFERKGVTPYVFDLSASHISDVMTRVLSARYVCVGSPTLNNNMMPSVAAFLTYMKGLAPRGRRGLAFGSYGWGGQSVKQIEEILAGSGFEIMTEGIRIKYVPEDNALAELSRITEEAVK
jgi:flavorubredoxin